MAKKKAEKKTELPKAALKFFAEMGRIGGSKTGPTKARDPEKMREAGKQSWKNRKPEN